MSLNVSSKSFKKWSGNFFSEGSTTSAVPRAYTFSTVARQHFFAFFDFLESLVDNYGEDFVGENRSDKSNSSLLQRNSWPSDIRRKSMHSLLSVVVYALDNRPGLPQGTVESASDHKRLNLLSREPRLLRVGNRSIFRFLSTIVLHWTKQTRFSFSMNQPRAEEIPFPI